MKYLFFLISIPLYCISCWRSESPQQFIRPVKLAEALPMNYYVKDFVGVVSAQQYTNLAFQVGGLISAIYINEGSAVRQGQILAQLDPQDYLLQLESDKAQYQSAQSILERNERLLEHQAISTQDVEVTRANYQQAKSAYAYAQNQVEYTRLRAPFDGSIETKFVEDFQKVAAGEKVFKLINPTLLDVNFTLPETHIQMLQAAPQYTVEFDQIRGKQFKASLKEVVDASVDGMGIPVTLSLTDPEFDPVKLNIKAGFACRVHVSLENRLPALKHYVKIPVTAVFTENVADSNKYVWIYHPDSGTVTRRRVVTQGLMGNSDVIVSEGIISGERVVTAGVYQLIDDQKVNVLK